LAAPSASRCKRPRARSKPGRPASVSLFDRIDYRTLSLAPDTLRDFEARRTARAAPTPDVAGRAAQAEMITAIERAIAVPTADRLFYVGDAIRSGISLERINQLTGIDPWFLAQMQRIVNMEGSIKAAPELSQDVLRDAKRLGFSDAQLANLRGLTQKEVRETRRQARRHSRLRPRRHLLRRVPRQNAVICTRATRASRSPTSARRRRSSFSAAARTASVRASSSTIAAATRCFALRELGIGDHHGQLQSETVSTDYDTSDRLYFEPLTLEDVLAICHEEAQKRRAFGGDRAVRRADAAEACRAASRKPAFACSAPSAVRQSIRAEDRALRTRLAHPS